MRWAWARPSTPQLSGSPLDSDGPLLGHRGTVFCAELAITRFLELLRQLCCTLLLGLTFGGQLRELPPRGLELDGLCIVCVAKHR